MFIILLTILPTLVLANSSNECHTSINETLCLMNCSCIYCFNNVTSLCLTNNTVCETYSYNDTCHKSNGDNSKTLYFLFLLLGLCPIIVIVAACASRGKGSVPIIVAV